MALFVKNIRRFQHYKDRKPPWIRFYRDVMDDFQLDSISGDAYRLLTKLWLIATEKEHDDSGRLPDIPEIAYRVRLPEERVRSLLSELDRWVVDDASGVLARCSKNAMPETEADTETESTRDLACASNNKSKLTPQDDETRRQDTRAQRSKTKRSCAEVIPLSSTGAEKVHQLITKLWPEYKDPSARETAARLHVGYGEKMNLLAEIEKARIAWPPERSVHAGNGLHGYLAAWMNNVQNAARDDEKGSQGPSIAKSLATLERDIKRGALLDPQKFAHAVNTAVEAGENLPLEIYLLIEAAVAAGNMERRRTGKIDPLWPTPERPSKIREPPGRQLTQEEVRKMVAKIGKKK